MQLPALCCGVSLLLLLVQPRAAAEPAGEPGAELRSLQDLLEALRQLRELEGEGGLEAEPLTGAEDGGSEWELPGGESGPVGTPVPEEEQNRWRSILSSHGRRRFSGCFGMRMERIGAQTGLGCGQHRARRSRVGAA
ncbi:ANF protein, partial [Brachypteracias leptosomus]|nr:ANF protein [Brachypteracias leptosomus]